MNKLLLFILLALAGKSATAQVTTNFNNQRNPIDSRGKFSKNFTFRAAFEIPAMDIPSLLERDKRLNTSEEAKPFTFAEAVAVDIDIKKEASWAEEGAYAFGKYTIRAKGANSISVNFDQFTLPPGSELYVYSENGEMITGPVTEKENNDTKQWGSWVYKGELLTVDFKVPTKAKDDLILHASSVGYGYKKIYKTEVGDFGESESCNINVLCATGIGWENERNSVALILNGSSTALCTGALITNSCNFNIPYVLTANHCFSGSVSNWKYTFQAWSPTCSPSQNATGTTFNGSTLRARHAGSDFCLVELNQVPPSNSGLFYAGWSRVTTGINQTTLIHHPRGDVMKISQDVNALTTAIFSSASCWRVGLDVGATEGGSSGCPYFDQNHRIIGQHFGHSEGDLPVCDRVFKFGGRFDVSWTGGGTNATRLSNWLDPNGSGATTTNTTSIANLISVNAANYPISGPTNMCTSATNYTLPALPAGATVAWSATPVGIASISSSGGTATITKVTDGVITLQAIITICGRAITVTRSLTIGAPPTVGTLNYYPSGVQYIMPGQYTYNICFPNGNVTLNFPSSTNLQAWAYTGPYVTAVISTTIHWSFNPSSYSSQTIRVEYDVPCGHVIQVITFNNTCGYRFSVSPNPTSDVIKINSQKSPDIPAQDMPVILQITIYDNTGNRRKQQLHNRTSEALISLSGLQPGIYFIEIASEDYVERQRIVVK